MGRGDKGKGGLFRRRDEGAQPAPPEDLGPLPLINPLAVHPELRAMADAVDRGDWPALREFVGEPADASDRIWAAEKLTERPGVEVVLEDAVVRHPEDTVAAALLGLRLIVQAWAVRGGGRADSVSREQFDLFHAMLRRADGIFLDTLAREPGNVYAASGRLTTARGLQLGEGEAVRRYEQLERQHPHVWPAQSALLQQLAPKWGGDWARMWQFAVRCAQAAPPGSLNPVLIVWYHLEQWIDLGDDAASRADGAYFRRPEVHADLVRAAESSVFHPAYRRGKDWDHIENTFAMAFSLSGDDARAGQLFRSLDRRMTESPWHYMADRYTAFRRARMRALLAVGAPTGADEAVKVPGPNPDPDDSGRGYRDTFKDLGGWEKGPKPNTDLLLGYPALRSLHTHALAQNWDGIADVLTGLSAAEVVRAVGELGEVPGSFAVVEKAAVERGPDDLAGSVYAALCASEAWKLRMQGAPRLVWEEQFRRADLLLRDGWIRRPGDVLVGFGRISVARGLEFDLPEVERRWEQLAEHHPHNVWGQRLLLTCHLPSWAGTWESAYEFARTCTNCSPAGSPSAVTMSEFHVFRAQDLGANGAGYFAQPIVRAELEEAADRSVLHPGYLRDLGWIERHNSFALTLALAESHARAARLFEDLDNMMTDPWTTYFTDSARDYWINRSRARRKAGT